MRLAREGGPMPLTVPVQQEVVRKTSAPLFPKNWTKKDKYTTFTFTFIEYYMLAYSKNGFMKIKPLVIKLIITDDPYDI